MNHSIGIMALLITMWVIVISAVVSAQTFAQKGNTDMAYKTNIKTELSPDTMNKTIILIGASYAKGLNLTAIGEYKLVNKGAGGEQSFEMLSRFEEDVISKHPDAVIIWGFINDIFRGDRNKIDDVIERIKESYIEMISKAQENGITPIVATEITMSKRPGIKEAVLGLIAKILGKTSYQEIVNEHVMAVNEWLRTYAIQQKLRLFDIQALLSEGAVMRKKVYAQKDGSHISEKGYQKISEYINNQIGNIE